MTCNNTSNNNMMVDKLTELVSEFAGDANHMQCFLHVVNLVAKTLLLQFEAKHKSIEDVEDNNWFEDNDDQFKDADNWFKDLVKELDDRDNSDDDDEMSEDDAES